MQKRHYRQNPRQSTVSQQSGRLMRGTTDLMLAGGTLMVGAGALGLVAGVFKK